MSFIKLNFDGSSKGNPGKSGIGFIVRDYHGTVIYFEAFHISPSTTNFVEAFDMLQGLSTATRLRVQHIHVEGDSSVIVNVCIQ